MPSCPGLWALEKPATVGRREAGPEADLWSGSAGLFLHRESGGGREITCEHPSRSKLRGLFQILHVQVRRRQRHCGCYRAGFLHVSDLLARAWLSCLKNPSLVQMGHVLVSFFYNLLFKEEKAASHETEVSSFFLFVLLLMVKLFST